MFSPNIIALLYLLILLVISVKISGYFSPSSILLSEWVVLFLMQVIFYFYNVSGKVFIILSFLITAFVSGSLISNTFKVHKCNVLISEKKITIVILLLGAVVVVCLPIVYNIIRNNVSFNSSKTAFLIRAYFVDIQAKQGIQLPVKIVSNVSIVLIVLLYIDKRINRLLKLLLIIIALIGISVTATKGYYILLIGYLISATIFFKDNPRKTVFILLIIGILVLGLFAVLRDNMNIGLYLKIYLFSSLPAFEKIVINEFKFGMASGSNFVNVPEPTNVFTAFGPAYSNWGFVLSSIYFFLTGLVSGLVYKLANRNYFVFKLFYGYILSAIISSIFSDGFWLITTITNYMILLYAIYSYVKLKRSQFKSEVRIEG